MIFIFSISIGIIITLSRKHVNKYWGDQSKISISDSLYLKIIETKYLRGYLSFNRLYYIEEGNFTKRSLDLWKVTEFELPFYVKKAANNDTLWIISDKERCFFIFRKDTD
jgi:hypothetical protein